MGGAVRPGGWRGRRGGSGVGVGVNGDIELEIGPGSGAGNYAVRVVRAAAGGEPTGTLELDVEEVQSKRELLEATVLASTAATRRSVSAAERPVREVGQQLFRALFTGPVSGTYRASHTLAQERGKPLRVVLRLTAPELAALPWEMLFDPETETYLCRREPLVRHVPAPYTRDPLQVHLPLRILGLVASPQGLQRLDVDAEKAHLAEALAGLVAERLVELIWAPEATWDGIHARLLAGEWHVLHFVGHGDYDTGRDEGMLALVGPNGRADMIEANRLADLLGEARPTPRLVVLNSCSSGQTGSNDLFSGTAAALVRSGISAVAAMQFAVTDTAAIAFARGFYTAIANGRSVDEAAQSGRVSILGNQGSLEWVTPVLYVRGQATQLFTLAPSRTGGRENPPPEDQARTGGQPPVADQVAESARHKQAQLSALAAEARAALRLGQFDRAIGLFNDLLILHPGYPDAAELRDKAVRSRQLVNTYTLATTAEDSGDWIEAARAFAEIVQIDPDYRDAAARKDACQKRQRVGDLQAELRQHADAGQWQAVLDADAELARLDASAADPDGLATSARQAVAAEQRAADLERRYAQARAAEDSGDWAEAARAFAEIVQIDPDNRDAAARMYACQRWQRVADLQAQRGQRQGRAGTSPPPPPRLDLTPAQLAALTPEQRAAYLERYDVEVRVGEDSVEWIESTRVLDQLTQSDLAVRHAAAAALHDLLRRQVALAGGKPAVGTAAPVGSIESGIGVHALSWHPDGRSIAVAAATTKASVYDISSTPARERLAVKCGHMLTEVHAVAFSTDGARLATGSTNKSARVWDAASGRKLLEVRHDAAVTAVAFSPDGARLATGSADRTARIWDAASQKQLLEVRHGGAVQGDAVGAVAVSPDGALLATGSADGTARIWDAASGQQLLEVYHDDPNIGLDPIRIRQITSAIDQDSEALPDSLRRRLEFHPYEVRAVAFSPDSTKLATGGEDHRVLIWPAAARTGGDTLPSGRGLIGGAGP